MLGLDVEMRVSYYTVGGEILGQEAVGSRSDYLPDALGSVVSTVDQAKAVIHTARYKPYGADLATTGTAPVFGWVGTLGYRSTGLSTSGHYVRARHYGSAAGRWISVDPLWLTETAYGYVKAKVVRSVDPTGTKIEGFPAGGPASNVRFCCNELAKPFWTATLDQVAAKIAACMAEKKMGFPNQIEFVKSALQNAVASCTEKGPRICVFDRKPDMGNCAVCTAGTAADVIQPLPVPSIKLPAECPRTLPRPNCDQFKDPGGGKCDCSVVWCHSAQTNPVNCSNLFHELAHCGGAGRPAGHEDHSNPHKDIVYALGCCTCRVVFGEDAVCGECGGFN